MKKNIKDYIGTKTVIWIDEHTIEQENAIKDLLLEDGRITRWNSGDDLKSISYLKDFTEKKGYCLRIDNEHLGVNSKKYYNRQAMKIIPASEFIPPKFVYGQEIEVSDYVDFRDNKTYKRKYMAIAPNGDIIAWSNNNIASNWKHARKINHERTQAIDTIKELMAKFNISKDEI